MMNSLRTHVLAAATALPLLRHYPSLALETRLYRDRDHFDVLPVIIGDGLKSVCADEAAKLEAPLY